MQVNYNGVKSLQSEGTVVLSQKQEGSGNLSNLLQSDLKHQLLVCPRVVPHITAPEMTKPTLFSLQGQYRHNKKFKRPTVEGKIL